MAIPNSTYRLLMEKLGGADPSQFVGNAGEIFFDPNIPGLKLSDGVSPGGLPFNSVGIGTSNVNISLVNSIDELQSVYQNYAVYVSQYYTDYDAEADLLLLRDVQKDGGGLFVWDSTIAKSEHDGGLFISPTVPYDGSRVNLEDFLNGVGETNSSGFGVWVRQFTGNVFASFFGQVGNNIANDQPSIQRALDRVRELNNINYVGAGNVAKTKTVEITGTCRVKKYLDVGSGIRLYGSDHTLSYPNQRSGFANQYNYVNGPVIYADAECELFNGRSVSQGKDDNCVVMTRADSSHIEGIVVDGFELPFGSWYPSISCRNPVTNVNAHNNFEGLLKVIDPDDDRQAGNLRIITEQVPAFYLGDTWHAGYQLIAAGGNRTGVGIATTIFTDVTPANPYQWDVISGTLPSGISVSKSGWVTCDSPTVASKTFIKLRVADAGGSTTKDLIFEVTGKYINPESAGKLPTATINTSYLYQPTLVNDDGVPHYWWLINGPKGLGIGRTTGIITGTPDANSYGEYKIKIGITTTGNIDEYNANTLIDSIQYDFVVTNSSDIRLDSGRLPNAIVNVPYREVLYAYGGVAPYTWEIDTSATLPINFENDNVGFPTATSPGPGLALTADGSRAIISGTATTTGKHNFQIKVTDSLGRFFGSLVIFSVDIAERPQLRLSINQTLPVAVKGQPYSYQVTSTQVGCAFSAVNLPTGLAISTTSGTITGTPTGGVVANGISGTYGGKLSNFQVRNFKNGAGLKFIGPTNVHIVNNFFVSSCDTGISSDNIFDSRFESFYIFACRVGLGMGGGTAANTYINGRIEYIYEDGASALFANDNIFTGVYFDTCGHAGITADRCKYWTIGDCVFYRSGRRVAPRGKHYSSDSYSKWSTHINLLRSDQFTISGNNFIRGSQDEGGSGFLRRYEEDRTRDWVRPYTCINLEDSKEIVVTGNNLAGCTRQSITPEVVPFELVDNDITLENNIVQYRDAFDTIKGNYKQIDNLFTNANKYNYVSEGNEEEIDLSYINTSLILHGDEFVDKSFRGYTLSNTNVGISSTTSIPGIGRSSFAFNGTSSLLAPNVSNNSLSTSGFYFGHNPWTFELQVNPIRNNVPQTLIDFGTTNESTTFAVALDSNGKLVIARNRSTAGQTTEFTSTETIPTNTWSRIAVCKTGGFDNVVRIYVNDSIVGTLTTEFDARFIISGFNRPTIGCGGFSGAADFYQGYMQEIRVTNNVSRYGIATTLTTQTKPWPDVDYGTTISPNTRIYAPKVGITSEFYWGNKSYSLKIGPTSNIANPVRITRKSQVDVIEDLRAGNGSIVSGNINPSKYYYNIIKNAEAGITSYSYQQCEFNLWLTRLGNVEEFNEMRGKFLNIVFYAKGNTIQPISIFNEFYAGTSDNAFKVDGGFFDRFTLTPFWRKYYFQMEFPAYELVRLNTGNCNAVLKFVMDDKSLSYDWDFGGLMVYPADGKFGHRRFIESSASES